MTSPDVARLWRGARWTLAVRLATLGTLGPFSIDTHLPAFAGIAASAGATPVQIRTLQGLSTGAGLVVSPAVIRDLCPPADAQRVMPPGTSYFGVAPAVAPMIGGWLFVHVDWHGLFWLVVLTIAGSMGGALLSGRVAGRIEPLARIRWGLRIMVAAAATNSPPTSRSRRTRTGRCCRSRCTRSAGR